MRGRNKDFLLGMLYIFRKNWNLNIDSHEIDLTLSYSENFSILYSKYVKFEYDPDDL